MYDWYRGDAPCWKGGTTLRCAPLHSSRIARDIEPLRSSISIDLSDGSISAARLTLSRYCSRCYYYTLYQAPGSLVPAKYRATNASLRQVPRSVSTDQRIRRMVARSRQGRLGPHPRESETMRASRRCATGGRFEHDVSIVCATWRGLETSRQSASRTLRDWPPRNSKTGDSRCVQGIRPRQILSDLYLVAVPSVPGVGCLLHWIRISRNSLPVRRPTLHAEGRRRPLSSVWVCKSPAPPQAQSSHDHTHFPSPLRLAARGDTLLTRLPTDLPVRLCLSLSALANRRAVRASYKYCQALQGLAKPRPSFTFFGPR